MFQARIVLTLIALLGVSVLAACSQPNVTRTATVSETTSSNDAHSSSFPSKPINAGVAVNAYIDPKTGELRDPTTEELAAGAAATDKKALSVTPSSEQSTPREVIHPGGIVEVPLDPSKQQALQACIEKDGSMKMGHECESAGKAQAPRTKP